MGLRFRKSFKIAPGVRMNVSSKSVGFSSGVKGLRYSVNSRTGSRVTASIPGTGLSYSTSGGRSRRTPAYNRQREIAARQREQEKLDQIEAASLAVEAYENTIERIHSIHKEADDPVNWIKVRSSSPPYEKDHGEMGPNEKSAVEKFKNYKPSFIGKLFKQEDKERRKLEEAIEAARAEDDEDYRSWERDRLIATKIIEGDIDAYFEVINEFAPLDDLLEFGSGFEFFAEDPKTMEIEFEVNSASVVPKEQLSLTKTGKLSTKAMTKTRYFDIQQDYVCSCILRIARDLFALLPLNTVYIHALDKRVNTATGYEEEAVILSVKIERKTLNKLNFDGIDCSDSMQNFEHNMKFKKTAGFDKVEKLEVSS